MKKILTFVLCVVLILSLNGTMLANENNKVIAGLEENLNRLFLINNFTREQIDEMDRQYIKWFDESWPGYLKGLKATGKMQTESDDTEYLFRLDETRINYDNGVLVSMLSSHRYVDQYANDGVFNYLFANKKYWSVPRYSTYGSTGRFTEDGMRFSSMKEIGSDLMPIIFPTEAVAFLRDVERIQQLLIEKEEGTVSEIKLFGLTPTLSFLYIRCDTNEYLIKLNDNTGYGAQGISQIELFKLYPILDGADGIREIFIQNAKPTYTTEAESLQAAGLLQGNEKGLDLLKPLTRMEATTLLVRVLGCENESTLERTQFTDIPDGSWGVKYANIAKDKGISYGVGDDKFAPDELVSSNQFATFVLRAVDEKYFDWQQGINILIERGIITEENAATMDLFARGDMAKIIYEAREKGLLISEN